MEEVLSVARVSTMRKGHRMGDGDKAEQWAAWAWVIMFNDDMDAWDALNHDERLRIRLLFGPPADCMSENLELEHTRWKAGAVVRDLLARKHSECGHPWPNGQGRPSETEANKGHRRSGVSWRTLWKSVGH